MSLQSSGMRLCALILKKQPSFRRSTETQLILPKIRQQVDYIIRIEILVLERMILFVFKYLPFIGVLYFLFVFCRM